MRNPPRRQLKVIRILGERLPEGRKLLIPSIPENSEIKDGLKWSGAGAS